ncbi:hypothetical protein BDB01DRAFT_714699 [Pilobolus umbonatus]|nr:hypothetical protein BDB01DRAFT_714699 [Pilobolus umbonatus]
MKYQEEYRLRELVINRDSPLNIKCPLLKPRKAPTNVHDLRADDIKIIAGLGDSIMSGFGAKGYDGNIIHIKSLNENRGVSFAMGGERGAITLPNIIRYYSPDLYGYSEGNHLITACYGDGFCPRGQHREEIDRFNAALSGSRCSNLDGQIDYLVDQLDLAYESNNASINDWKLITIFIGSNDICHSCTVATSSPNNYEAYLLKAVDRIRNEIPNTIVQLLGLLRVQEVKPMTEDYASYCKPIKGSDVIIQNYICECSHTVANRTIMRDNHPLYDNALKNVADHFQAIEFDQKDTFAVAYHPFRLDITTLPIQALR